MLGLHAEDVAMNVVLTPSRDGVVHVVCGNDTVISTVTACWCRYDGMWLIIRPLWAVNCLACLTHVHSLRTSFYVLPDAKSFNIR